MGRRVFKQPNGNYAMFSTVVDDFLATDMTLEEVKQDIMADRYGRIALYEKYRDQAETEDARDNYQYIVDQEQELVDMTFNQYMQRHLQDQNLGITLGIVAANNGTDVAMERIHDLGCKWEDFEQEINKVLAECAQDS